MFGRTIARIFFIWLTTIACDVSQPLPPPQLPATHLLSCVTKGCVDNKVCHPGVGGGVCADACSSNADCDAIVGGYLCHPGLGQTCAPPCTDDASCKAVADGTRCNGSYCEPDPAAAFAHVRVFNALASKSISVVRSGVQVATDLATGQASSSVALSPGDTDLHVFIAGAEVAGLGGQAFGAGREYTVVVWQRTSGYVVTPVQTSTASAVPQGSAMLAYVSAADRVFTQGADEVTELRINNGVLFGSVHHGGPRLGGVVAAGTSAFTVDAVGRRTFITANVDWVAGKRYLLVFWRSLAGAETDLAPVAQATLLDENGVVSTTASASIRFLFASQSSSSALVIDGESFNFTSPAQSIEPAQSFYPINAGMHHITATRPVEGQTLLDGDFTLVAGQAYTVIAGGVLPTGPAGAVLYSETPPSDLPAGSVQLRTAHFCADNTADALTLTRDPADVVATALPFASVSTPVVLTAAEMASFTATLGATTLVSGPISFAGVRAATLVCSAGKLRVLTSQASRPLP